MGAARRGQPQREVYALVSGSLLLSSGQKVVRIRESSAQQLATDPTAALEDSELVSVTDECVERALDQDLVQQ